MSAPIATMLVLMIMIVITMLWPVAFSDENVDDDEGNVNDFYDFDDHHIVAGGFILGRTVKH